MMHGSAVANRISIRSHEESDMLRESEAYGPSSTIHALSMRSDFRCGLA